MKTPEEFKAEMIQLYGDDAYRIAVSIMCSSARVGDIKFATLAADAAKLLMQEGYHKKPNTKKP